MHLKETSHSCCQYTNIPVIKRLFHFFKWQYFFHPISVKWSPRHADLPKPHLSSLSNYSQILTGIKLVKKKKKIQIRSSIFHFCEVDELLINWNKIFRRVLCKLLNVCEHPRQVHAMYRDIRLNWNHSISVRIMCWIPSTRWRSHISKACFQEVKHVFVITKQSKWNLFKYISPDVGLQR